jgi:Putative prokaryotic signal transducing protein
MKRVYIATNLPDAQLVRNLLEHAGITTHIFNENAASYYGGAALPAACPHVWIQQPHQETHARSIIAEYLRPSVPMAAKFCGSCGESNPGEFEVCWNCGEALPIVA